MEMDDNKRRRNMILYVLIAFVVYLVLSTVLFPNIGHTQQITKTDYSTFVKALDKKSVDKVEYNTDDYTIYYTKKGEDENIAYKTTGVPNDAGFTDRVLESGASLESVVPDKNSGLMTYYLLTLILPMAIFFLIGWWLNRRMKKAMGDDGPSMNFGGGHLAGGSTVQTNLTGTAFTFDNVGFKAFAIVVISDVHFFSRNHVGSIQQVFVNRDTTHVVQICLCDTCTMNFRLQHFNHHKV